MHTHYRLLDADAYLEGVLSIELTDVAAENIWAPDDGEVLRRHPRPIGVQRHLVQVPHQEVDRPEIMEGSTFKVGLKALLMSPVVGGGESVENLSELLSSLPLGQLARQHQVGVEVVRHQRGRQVAEIQLKMYTMLSAQLSSQVQLYFYTILTPVRSFGLMFNQ